MINNCSHCIASAEQQEIMNNLLNLHYLHPYHISKLLQISDIQSDINISDKKKSHLT